MQRYQMIQIYSNYDNNKMVVSYFSMSVFKAFLFFVFLFFSFSSSYYFPFSLSSFFSHRIYVLLVIFLVTIL